MVNKLDQLGDSAKAYMPGDHLGRPIGDNDGEWMPFVDWGEVYAGNRTKDRFGQFGLFDSPLGISVKVEEASVSDPILTTEEPWEQSGGLLPLSAWTENGECHMLYRTHGTAYARSNDGYNWERPNMDQIPFDGSTNNNLVCGEVVGTVVDDPESNPNERYKAMMEVGGMYDAESGEPLKGDDGLDRLKALSYEGYDYKGAGLILTARIRGYTSPDRLHWNVIKEPIGDMPSDGTGANPEYDQETKTYFAYLRVHGLPPTELKGLSGNPAELTISRRAIGLSRTKDFHHWPPPKLVLFPDALDPADTSFYGGFYFKYPHRKDLHCMLVHVMHQATGNVDTQIAFSSDGIIWNRPERSPIIPTGKVGTGYEGTIYPQGGFVELPDGHWAVPFCGGSTLHNGFTHGNPDVSPKQLRWARWSPHRVCGIQADHEGRFTIGTVRRSKNQLKLNYRCNAGGWIKAEIIGAVPSRIYPDTPVLPGFSFDDCDWITGDSSDQTITWQGKSDISSVGNTVAIRIKMFNAKVFAYQI